MVSADCEPTSRFDVQVITGKCDAFFLGLRLGLLITLCASASAATVHHSRHHVIVRPSQGWAYAAPRPAVHYDDTPSYNDPSKFGGGTAL
jgi:hypothetical protein